MNINISALAKWPLLLSISLLLSYVPNPSQAGPLTSDLPLKNFRAEYVIELAGIKVGRLSRELIINSDRRYVFKSTSRTAGLSALFQRDRTEETALGVLDIGTFIPHQYQYSREKSGKLKEETLEFDYEQNIVTKTRKGMTKHNKFNGKVFDPLSYQLQLMSDLALEQQQASYLIHSPKKEKRYVAEIGDRELIQTPYGGFNSLKLTEITQSDKRTTFWCAKELNYLPVKVLVQDEDRNTLILLESYELLQK